MKVRRYQASEEKTILTAMIVHDRVLGKIYQLLGSDRKIFKNRWSNLIAKWCFEYYAKYQKAPKKAIQNLFIKYSESEGDEESIEIVDAFLQSLNEEYKNLEKEMNEQWVIDLASSFFDKVRLERLAKAIEDAIEKGDVESAREAKESYNPVTFSSSDWINPFDRELIYDTMMKSEDDQVVVRFPGDLGKFLSPFFERDGFISFAAPEKKGKSYWLMEAVWQALRQRRRVLYYVLGDMSQRQVLLRLYRRATLRPLRDKKGLRVPISIKPGKDEKGLPKADVEYEERDYSGMSTGDIAKAARKLQATTATKTMRLRIKCAGASIVSASNIEADIQDYVREEGVPPDLVVVDYADLLAAERNSLRMEYRHQINETWKVMRRISTDYHLLMLTATQAAARAYDSWVIRKKDFSEDKRKNAHVTGMLGINQTADEKKQGIYRLNWAFLRDGEWTETQCVWTAGNLALACPCLKSSL